METGSFYQQFQGIIEWVGAHPTIAGVIIFLVAMFESLVVIGILVPGAVLMVGAGVLISLDKLELWPCIAWAAAGAVAGDGFSFWVGHHYKDRLRQIWPFSKSPKLLTKGEVFFNKHGGKSVVLGRFVGPIRAIIPTIAGMMGMSATRFTIVNVLSALVWAPAYILPGLVVGASLQLASEIALRLVIAMVVTIIVLFITIWAVKHIVKYLHGHAHAMTHAVLEWGGRHPFVGRYTNAILTPESTAYKSLIISGSLFLLASISFVFIFIFGVGNVKDSGFSYTTFSFLHSLRTPLGDQLMVSITMLAHPWVYGPVLLTTCIVLIKQKIIVAVSHLLFTVGIAAILMWILALTVMSPGPHNANTAIGYSFPGVDITLSLIIYGFIAVLLSRGSQQKIRSLAYVLFSTAIIFIAFSLLYLGQHWLSDIIASMLLGLILLSLTGISFQRHLSKEYSSKPLLISLSLTLSIAMIVFGSIHFDKQFDRYRPFFNTTAITEQQWQSTLWQTLPTWRNDLRNQQHQPMNIQFLGNIENLKKYLLKKGWKVPAKFQLTNMIHWLNSDAKLSQLPVLPQVHQGRHHELLLSYSVKNKKGPPQQQVLRLWRSHYAADNKTLYIGNVSSQTGKRSLRVLSLPNTGRNFNQPMNLLLTQIRPYQIGVRKRQIKPQKKLIWDGRVILVKDKKQ